MKKFNLICIVAMLFAHAFLFGCASPPTNNAVNNTVNTTNNETVQSYVNQCTTKSCLISSANECKATSLTSTEDYGAVSYASTANCTLTKTIITLDANETQQMKTLLEGKSMTCIYENGKFDADLVNTMVFGIENCTGDLSDNLRILIVFATD